MYLPLQREALDAEALEEDTVRAEKEASLVGDGREDRRRSLMGAGPLLGQLHFLPSVEANGVNVSTSVLSSEATKSIVFCSHRKRCGRLTMRGCCGCKGTNWLRGVRCGGWWGFTDGAGCNTKCSLEIRGGKA